jgi:hypothetical protein
MRFIIATIAQAKAHGIEIIPTMRQSVDKTQVVLHEEYVKNIDEFNALKRYEFDNAEFTELMASEAWTHGEDYVQPNEDFAKVSAVQILTADTKAQINTMSLSNNEALEVKKFYPEWKEGISVKVGEKYRYGDDLWEVVQSHTTQSDWIPSLSTASLWKRVDVEHDGTEADPIPYAPPMELFNGKYYIQDEIKYKCTRDSQMPLPHNLSELVGLYVELV